MRVLPILGGFLFFTCLLWFNCSPIGEEVVSNQQTAKPPDQEIYRARVIFSQNEKVMSVLEAARILVFEPRGLTVADSAFRLDIFDQEGRHTSLVTGDSGVVTGENFLAAYGKVVVISDSGMVLNTERLFWDRQRRTIRSDTLVKLTSQTDVLYGDSLHSDESLDNWQVFNPRGETTREWEK